MTKRGAVTGNNSSRARRDLRTAEIDASAMEAFDRLPPALRRALAQSVTDWHVVQLAADMVRYGYSTPEVLRVIAQEDEKTRKASLAQYARGFFKPKKESKP